MKRSPSRRATVTAVAAATLLLILAGPNVASATDHAPAPQLAQLPGPGAEPPTVEELQALPTETALTGATPTSAPGQVGIRAVQAGVGVNPNGCQGLTMDPHKSGIYASVHGRTTCEVWSQNLSVATILYRHDWWGMNAMAEDDAHRANGTSSGDAHPHSSCDYAPSRTYSGYSSHTVTIGGKLYGNNTSNTTTFRCDY